MSRSNPNSGSEKPTNPATKFFQWSSNEKCLKYYDKATETEVLQKIPFPFLVLDQLSTVSGYRKRTRTVIWANEVRDTTKEIMHVRSRVVGAKTIETEGDAIYKDLNVKDLKFIKSVYIAFLDSDKTWKIGNIAMKGSALTAWIEFTNPDKEATRKGATRPDLNKNGVKLNSFVFDGSGDVEFNKPVFVEVEIPKEINDIAIEKDKELQAYLVQYFSYVNSFGKKDETANETPSAMTPNTDFATQGTTSTPAANNASRSNAPQSEQFVDTSDLGTINQEDDLPF